MKKRMEESEWVIFMVHANVKALKRRKNGNVAISLACVRVYESHDVHGKYKPPFSVFYWAFICFGLNAILIIWCDMTAWRSFDMKTPNENSITAFKVQVIGVPMWLVWNRTEFRRNWLERWKTKWTNEMWLFVTVRPNECAFRWQQSSRSFPRVNCTHLKTRPTINTYKKK